MPLAGESLLSIIFYEFPDKLTTILREMNELNYAKRVVGNTWFGADYYDHNCVDSV